jgi:hypothetical protein
MATVMTKNSLVKADRLRFDCQRYVPILIAGIAVLSLALPLAASALTSISQSYTATSPLPSGSIVSLQNNSSDQVVPAVSSNTDNLLGVVINADNSLLSLSNSKDNQVQVATSGTVQALVSDINGTVARGDNITASPISGVGMKATGNVRIIGTAQGEVSHGSKQTYKDKDGREHTVMIGDIPLLVNVSYYFKQPDKTIVPSALQSVANALAGKAVSALPILLSVAIFVIMLIVVASIVYAMIRSSIISVGRNPMSQSAIYRDLIQLSALVLVILGVGLISIYMVLTRL